jgi:hypothetical protein
MSCHNVNVTVLRYFTIVTTIELNKLEGLSAFKRVRLEPTSVEKLTIRQLKI